MEMIIDATYSNNRESWGSLYDNNPRTLPVDGSDPIRVLSALSTQECIIEVYHRAMDRFPGGNSDIHVIKQTYVPLKGTIAARDYCNWDGGSNILSEQVLLPEAKVALFSNVIPALDTLFQSNPSRDITCTVDDPSCDSDEYDTEWSSIEILVFDSERKSLLGRVHQRSRLTVDRNREPVLRDALPASPETQNVLDQVEVALQMGRVEKFSDGENPDIVGKRIEWDWHGYIIPLYLGDNY
jgi:hypothetical protein